MAKLMASSVWNTARTRLGYFAMANTHPLGEWWCVPTMSRAQRKRRGLRRQPKPHKARYEDCFPYGHPRLDSNDVKSLHMKCGYRNAIGQVIPWVEDPRR